MEPELIVVGGGPVGSTVAALTAPSADTLVAEEHAEIGSPVQCTGLVHPRVLEMAGASDAALNSLTGLRLHFPGGREIEVRSDETKAVVIDRRRFDRLCMQRAVEEGADVLVGCRFQGFRREGGGVEVSLRCGGQRSIRRAKLLVGADGYRSEVGRMAGLDPAREVIRGIQVDVDAVMDDQHVVNVLVGKKVAPGFFAWVLPCGGFTRVGLGVGKGYGAPSRYLRALLERSGLDKARRLTIVSGAIPIGPPRRTYADNVLIVGDAAGQAKPLSGGGLFTGMRAARWAARTALEAIAEGDCSASLLARYQERWRADIGKEVDRGLLIRKVLASMSDKRLDEAGRMLDREDVKAVLSSGDIDYPSKLTRPLLRTMPSLIKFSPQVIGALLRQEERAR